MVASFLKRVWGLIMKKLLLASVALAALSAAPAFAADAIVEEPVLPVGFNWTGAYIGVHGGYSWGNGGTEYLLPAGALVERIDTDANGWLGGVQVGYNYQVNNWVFGVEGDIAVSGADAGNNIFSLAGADVADVDVDSDWQASLTVRAGYALDRTLFYAKGGVGFADLELTDKVNVTGVVNAKGSDTAVGWTVGGGVEHAFNDHWTIKGEYQFYRLNADVALNTAAGVPFRIYDENFDIHAVKIGLNYKF